MDKKLFFILTGCFLINHIIYGSSEKFYIEGFQYGTEKQKLEILEQLSIKKNKIYLPQIAELLSDPSKEVRSKAVYTLLKIGDSTCIPYFKKALDDSWWQVRLYGIKGLVEYGESDIISDLIKGLDDSYWQVRYYSAVGLGKYGDENVMEVLIEHLKDENGEVVEEILWALSRLMWRDEARAKFKKLSEESLKPLFEKLKAPQISLKIRTIWVLEATGDERVIPYLIETLEDTNDEVKIRTMWALENLKATSARYAIESKLEEPSLKVKKEAIKSLVRLKSQDTVDGLIKKLKEPDEEIKIYALWALERINEPITYPEIVTSLLDPSLKVKEYAAKIIEDIKDPRFYPSLQALVISDVSPLDVKILCLQILGKIGDKTVKEFLFEISRKEIPSLRVESLNSLFLIDKFDEKFLRTLCFIENFDKIKYVREKANVLLKNIIEQVISKLKSTNIEERTEILGKIEFLEGSKNFDLLLKEMAKSKYPEVREKMSLIAIESPDKRVIKNLHALFKEPDISIKKNVSLALGEIKDKTSISLLKDGLKSFDPELQINCAWALAKIGSKEGLPIAINFLNSKNIEFQKKSVEVLGYIGDKKTSSLLLKTMSEAEPEIKVICGWALARMGEVKGIETLVELSEKDIEPLRTQSNIYLADTSIPKYLKEKIPSIREEIHNRKIGVQEIYPKIIKGYEVSTPIIIDGKDDDRFWGSMEKDGKFLLLGEEKIPAEIQTKVGIGYDDKNLYFLFICEDPKSSQLNINSRDFVTICLNPKNSSNQWYQFVIHPVSNFIKYAYIWKFYKNEEPEKFWQSNWKAETSIESNRWIAEISIPLSDIKIEKITKGIEFGINFQRESSTLPLTTWTGRIDNPEQFGTVVFEGKE